MAGQGSERQVAEQSDATLETFANDGEAWRAGYRMVLEIWPLRSAVRDAEADQAIQAYVERLSASWPSTQILLNTLRKKHRLTAEGVVAVLFAMMHALGLVGNASFRMCALMAAGADFRRRSRLLAQFRSSRGLGALVFIDREGVIPFYWLLRWVAGGRSIQPSEVRRFRAELGKLPEAKDEDGLSPDDIETPW